MRVHHFPLHRNPRIGVLRDLANIHVKMERIGGTIVIYGEEPFTECNALEIEEGDLKAERCRSPRSCEVEG